MAGFLDRLAGGEILVADGATGTNLQKAGLPPGAHAEDWVFENPQAILDLETSFVAAGAEILLTCTFGATRHRLKGSKYVDRVAELNYRAVELSRRAASSGTGVMVAGSIGPLGQLLSPYGPLTLPEATASYAEQARALSEGGVDLLVIETQYSLDEAIAAFGAARSVSDLPIVVSFSYDRGVRTMMGAKPADVATRLRDVGVALVGANCGTTLAHMIEILDEYACTIPGTPLWAKPNAGVPRMEAGAALYDMAPQELAEFAVQAAKLGARVIGGCCGATAEHVQAVARAVRTGSLSTR